MNKIIGIILSKKFWWTIFILSLIGWTTLFILKFFLIGYKTWDIGAHIQAIFNLSLHSNYFSNFIGMHHLADHFWPGLALFVPFLKIWANPFWFLLAKLIAYFACPIILLYISKKHFKNKKLVYLLPLLWLINDPLINVLSAQNISTALTMPFIILSFYFAYIRKYYWMFFSLIFLSLFKEYMPQIWLCVGTYIFIEQKRHKMGLLTIICGLLIGFGMNFYSIPFFRYGLESLHNNNFAPFQFIGLKFLMVLKALLSIGLIPLLLPRYLLYIIPAFGVYLMTNKINVFFLVDHYHDLTMATIFAVSFLVLLKYQNNKTWFNNWKSKSKQRLFVVIILILFINSMPKNPFKKIANLTKNFRNKYSIYKSVQQFKKELPLTTEIWADEYLTFYFLEYANIQSFDQYHFPKFNFERKNNYFIIIPVKKYSLLRADLYDQFKLKISSMRNIKELSDNKLLKIYRIETKQ